MTTAHSCRTQDRGPTTNDPRSLVFDTLPGLFIGIGISLLLLLYRVDPGVHPTVREAVDAASDFVEADA